MVRATVGGKRVKVKDVGSFTGNRKSDKKKDKKKDKQKNIERQFGKTDIVKPGEVVKKKTDRDKDKKKDEVIRLGGGDRKIRVKDVGKKTEAQAIAENKEIIRLLTDRQAAEENAEIEKKFKEDRPKLNTLPQRTLDAAESNKVIEERVRVEDSLNDFRRQKAAEEAGVELQADGTPRGTGSKIQKFLDLLSGKEAERQGVQPFTVPEGIIPGPGSRVKQTGGIIKDTAKGLGIIGREIKQAVTGANKASNKLKAVQNRNVNRISGQLGISKDKVNKAIERGLLKQSVDDVVRQADPRKFAKRVGKGLTAVAGADVIFEWYAIDNILDGEKFYRKDILEGLNDGSISRSEAARLMEEADDRREIAINFVDKSAMFNPILWAFRNLIMTGVEASNSQIDLIKAQVDGIIGGQIETSRERDIREQQEDIERFQEGTRVREEESRERELEAQSDDALFFEAIRKRNAGDRLSGDEKDALQQRGIEV